MVCRPRTRKRFVGRPASAFKGVVIDARGHLMGRLASIVAKQLLLGRQVSVVRTEEIHISGPMSRHVRDFRSFLRKRHITQPRKGPFHYRSPALFFWRVVRGMLPYKKTRGKIALRNLKVSEGIPPPYDALRRSVVPEAISHGRIQQGRQVTLLADLCERVGWKYRKELATFESRRKEACKAHFEIKKQLIAAKKKAIAEA